MIQYIDFPYLVSRQGQVFREGSNKPLLGEDVKGYRRVSLSNKGKLTRVSVHRMVAECYLPNPLNKPYINHIDHNRSNNDVSNLEWCTHSENMIHCHRHNRCSNTLATNASITANAIRTEEAFIKSFGDSFIKRETLNKGNGNRTYITFSCHRCTNTHRIRTDSTLASKEGLCSACYKVKMKI